MTKSSLLAVAAASAFAFAGLPAHAQYRASPVQSLSGSCQDVQTLDSGYITAECRDSQGRYRWSSIYYPYCRSDVSNRDGVLYCIGAEPTVGGYAQPRNANAAPIAAIIGAIAGALINGNDNDQSGWSDINQRQANLDARIDAGVRDRSLTTREAASLRSDFQALARLEADYRRDGLNNNERADLDRRFDLLSNRIEANRTDGQTGWSNINQRQANLDARIDAGVRDRSLTSREAASLRADFQALVRLEADYRRGGLTNRERAELDRRFDLLSDRINANRNDGQTGWSNINQRQANLDARIDAGVRDRSLTNREAASLRADFQALVRLEADYRRGGLTNSERAELDRRFDLLSNRIEANRNDNQTGWSNINQRQANLDARIDAGVRDRSLTNREAASLRSDFQALVRLEATYRRNGLTNAERADLDRRFDILSARIRSDRQDDQTGWANINQRQASLDARIDAGVRDRSLSYQEAAQLRAEFQALVRLEADYRRGGLTSAERADLDRRFDMLSARIRSERRDR